MLDHGEKMMSSEACAPNYQKQAEKYTKVVSVHAEMMLALGAFLSLNHIHPNEKDKKTLMALYGELSLKLPSMKLELDQLVEKYLAAGAEKEDIHNSEIIKAQEAQRRGK